ncbi:MAG: ABC transporter permease [Thermomicrobiales bacterium]
MIGDENHAGPTATWRGRLAERIDVCNYGIVLSFLTLFVSLSLASDKFLTKRNLLNVLDQSAPVGINACGATLCIIGGSFDLSVGAIFGVSAVVACKVAIATTPWLGIAAGMLEGAGLGLINAVIVNQIRINSFIATLASSIVFRGAAIIVTGGLIITVTDEQFATLGTRRFLDAKYSVWVYLAFIAVTWFILSRTALGRYIYAIGGNVEAARLSGIRVEMIRGATFAISGLSAGIAGVLAASRTSSAQPDLGMGLELSAIAAAVVGGTSILGGEGAIWRAVLGVLILAMIGNGFNLLNIDTTYQLVVQGALILVAVAADQLVWRGR